MIGTERIKNYQRPRSRILSRTIPVAIIISIVTTIPIIGLDYHNDDQLSNMLSTIRKLTQPLFVKAAQLGVGLKTPLGSRTIEVQNPKPSPTPTPIPKPILANISAYTASVDETDSRPWETAMQTRARKGIVATNNRAWLGKKVKVDGKVYLVEDMMGKKYRDAYKNEGKVHFDIFFDDKNQAFKFGRQNLGYEILD